jgi:hypothetical protein
MTPGGWWTSYTSQGSEYAVGVVGDVLQSDLRTTVHPEMYVPSAARAWRRFHRVLRVDG